MVGTRASREIELARLRRCVAVGEACRAALPRWRRGPALAGLLEQGIDEVVGWRIARLLRRDGDRGHARALALVDELVAIGATSPAVPARAPQRALVWR